MKKIAIILLTFLLVSCNTNNIQNDNNSSDNTNLNNTDVVDNNDGNTETVNEWWLKEWEMWEPILDNDKFSTLLEEGKYTEAEQLLSDANAEDNKEILKGYWRVNFEQQKFEEALTYYEKINTIQEWKDYDILYMIWIIYDNLWDKDKAVEFVNKSISIKPDYQYAKEYLEMLEKQKIEMEEMEVDNIEEIN